MLVFLLCLLYTPPMLQAIFYCVCYIRPQCYRQLFIVSAIYAPNVTAMQLFIVSAIYAPNVTGNFLADFLVLQVVSYANEIFLKHSTKCCFDCFLL